MGGGMNFYGELPDSYNLVVNSNHPVIEKISNDLKGERAAELESNNTEITRLKEQISFMEGEHKKLKEEDITQAEKDDLEKLRSELGLTESSRKEILELWGNENKVVKQLIDLALLSNNLLRGEELNNFVKRSIELL